MDLLQITESEDKSSPFKNCLRNHYRHLKKWAKRTETNCFRIFDRDISNYPIAIDVYGGLFSIHYFSPSREISEPPATFFDEVNTTLEHLFGVPPSSIFWRTRAKKKETRQYEKQNTLSECVTVYEHGAKFLVNLTDYLDTGLFLDHRQTRQLVAAEAKGKKLLNLFAYTGAFSIQAGFHGAESTKTVDMSNTYTEWARKNIRLNELPESHNEVIRADCMKFLLQEKESSNCYDLIVIDPPTISRSKKMETLFDIQKDYYFLIDTALCLLKEKGTIYFSTNSRKFSFDFSLFPHTAIQEITNKTEAIDFKGKNTHRCWIIKK